MAVISGRSIDKGETVLLVVLAAIAYVVCTVTYRLFFSPMSKIPGPWLTNLTGMLEANALKEQRRTKWVADLFVENPGAVAIRTGPNAVSFNHPDAIKVIYGMWNPKSF